MHTWKRLLDEGGIDALREVPERGRPASLDAPQLAAVRAAVLRSPTEHGFGSELWTLKRVGSVIERMHGVRFGQTQVWRILGALGFSSQKPQKRALERDENAVRSWKRAFLPPYAPDLNPVEYLWAWLKRHALANYCPDNLADLHISARNRLKSAQRRPSIIAAGWTQATLW